MKKKSFSFFYEHKRYKSASKFFPPIENVIVNSFLKKDVLPRRQHRTFLGLLIHFFKIEILWIII